MVSNRIILGAVAFGVSFGISFLSNRNPNRALLTSLIALPATYTAAIVVDKRRKHRELLVLASQRHKIQELEAQEINLNRLLSQASFQKQDLEHSINYLQNERHRLYNQCEAARNDKNKLQKQLESLQVQTAHSQEYLHNLQSNFDDIEQQKLTSIQFSSQISIEKEALEKATEALRLKSVQLQKNITETTQYKEDLEQEILNLNTQLQNLAQQVEKNKLKLSLQASQQQNIESATNELQLKYTQLKQQITQLQSDKEAIENLHDLKEQKRQIEVKTYILQTQTEKLEQHKADIQRSLASLKAEKEELKTSLQSLQLIKEQQAELLALQAERNQLQSQILEFQHQLEALIVEPSSIDDQQEFDIFPFSDLIDSLETPEVNASRLNSEWIEFMEQLTGYEIQILKAILEQNNLNKIIKEVADAKITMPAILLDNINQCAIENIGDSIIEINSEPIHIIEDYYEDVKNIIQMYEDIMKT